MFESWGTDVRIVRSPLAISRCRCLKPGLETDTQKCQHQHCDPALYTRNLLDYRQACRSVRQNCRNDRRGLFSRLLGALSPRVKIVESVAEHRDRQLDIIVLILHDASSAASARGSQAPRSPRKSPGGTTGPEESFSRPASAARTVPRSRTSAGAGSTAPAS